MSAHDNQPAFPLADSCCEYGGTNRSAANGMTLRDYFAAKAMAALIQSELLGDHAEIAPAAYAMADDMLAVRKEGGAA